MRVAAAVLTACLFAVEGAGQLLAPYVPSAPEVVDRMLALADVTAGDVVYDLGSGDGRIPIAAARKYGARAVGIELDAKLVEQARENARTAGVAHLVEFRQENILTADVSDATVVTLYLMSAANAKLRPLLTKSLQPGARIVSQAFSMGSSWPAERTERFTSASGDEITLYLWRADGKVRP